MCGISFSFINYKIKNQNVKKKIIKINKLINEKNFKESLNELKALRCNETFIEIIKSENSFLKKELNIILKKISFYKEKNIIDKTFDVLEDIIWIIEHEILLKCGKIKQDEKK